MKLLMIATALLVLSGCERAAEVEQQSRLNEQQVTTPEPVPEFSAREIGIAGAPPAIYILTDNETGCQYIGKYGDNGPLTPRLNHLGKPICNKVVAQ